MAGPDTSNINALLARGVGPSMLEGAHTAYFGGRAGLEQAQQQRLVEGDQNIPAAMAGDKNALGQVAARNPQAAVAVVTALSRMDAASQAKAKAAAEFDFSHMNAVLQADPKDQPAMYQQMLHDYQVAGHPTSNLPPVFDNTVPPLLRYHRQLSQQGNEYFKAQDDARKKQLAPGKAAGAGGGGSGEVWGDGKQSSLPSTGPVVADATPGSATGSATATLASQASPIAPNVQPAPAFAPPDANRNVMPPGIVPPQDDPEVINPGMPPMPAVQQASAGAPQGFQAMGHRDPQGNLVPALIDGKPVYRNPQTGEMQLGAPVQMAQAGTPQEPINPKQATEDAQKELLRRKQEMIRSLGGQKPVPGAAPLWGADASGVLPSAEPVPDQSSGGTNEQGPGGALPPGIQEAKLGDRYSPKIVFDNPAERGGVYGTAPGEKGQRKIITGPGGGAIFKLPDGTYEEYKPDLKPPKPGVGASIPPDLRDLHGEDFKATPFFQSYPYRNNVEGLISGRLKPSDLTGRSQDKNQIIEIAQQIDDSYTPSSADALRRFRTIYMGGDGTGGKTELAVNTAVDHMKQFHDIMNIVANGQLVVPNQITNYIKTQFGIPDVTNAQAAKQILATEIVRTVKGGQPMNEPEQKAANDILNPNSSPEQTQGALNTLTGLMLGRVHALQDFAKNKGVTDKEAEGYLHPRAQEALDYMKNNPIGKAPVGGDENIPVMTPEQVRASPSGTRYKTTDGRPGVKP